MIIAECGLRIEGNEPQIQALGDVGRSTMKKLFSASVLFAFVLCAGTLGVAKVGRDVKAGALIGRSGTADLRFVPKVIRLASKRLSLNTPKT